MLLRTSHCVLEMARAKAEGCFGMRKDHDASTGIFLTCGVQHPPKAGRVGAGAGGGRRVTEPVDVPEGPDPTKPG